MIHSYSILLISAIEAGCEVKFSQNEQFDLVCDIIKNDKIVFSRSRVMGEEDNLVFDVLYQLLKENIENYSQLTENQQKTSI